MQYQVPQRVLAAVIRRHGRLLLCQRPPHKRHGGLWEFPGGKVEAGESDLEAVRRELREELAVEVTWAGAVSFAVLDPGSEFRIEFLPVEIAGEPAALEHTRVAWFRAEELSALALAPSDRRFVEARRPGAAG
jgi:mutator protein MutT